MAKLATCVSCIICIFASHNSIAYGMQSLPTVHLVSYDVESPKYQPTQNEIEAEALRLKNTAPLVLGVPPGHAPAENSNFDMNSSPSAMNSIAAAANQNNIDAPSQQVVTVRRNHAAQSQQPQPSQGHSPNSDDVLAPLTVVTLKKSMDNRSAESPSSDNAGSAGSVGSVGSAGSAGSAGSVGSAGSAGSAGLVKNRKPVRRRRKTPQQRLMDMSDPQNYGLRFCWRFLWPVSRAVYNWGWLVNFRECLQNANSPFYQISNEKDVCTSTGGMEVVNTAYDGSATPFKVACIPRRHALLSDAESCWAVATKVPILRLERVPSSQSDAVCGSNMPWPFYDGRHVSSRFGLDAGGIESLFKCNGGLYKSAVVIYHLNLSGDVTGFGRIDCVPSSDAEEPNLRHRCKAPGHHCLHYLDPDLIMTA